MSDDSQPDAQAGFDQDTHDRSRTAISNASYQRTWRSNNRNNSNASTAKYRQGSSKYKRYRALYMRVYRKNSKANAASDP